MRSMIRLQFTVHSHPNLNFSGGGCLKNGAFSWLDDFCTDC